MGNNRKIIWLDSTDSTNDEVRRRIHTLDNLSVIAAKNQTKGRGQGDHIWQSAPGENLTFTILVKYGEFTSLKARDAAIINDIVTSSLLNFLSGHGIKARVKLPNDIYVGDKKICGILIENILRRENIDTGIIGIGIDVNQTDFPKEIPNPVSMASLTGKKFNLEELLGQFLEEFEVQLRGRLY